MVQNQQAQTDKDALREAGYVVDRASGRIISTGPEEIDATQPLLAILIDEAGWDAAQIVSRPGQWRVPSSPSAARKWPVDIAIFDSPLNLRDPAHVIIVCECKRPDVQTGIEQLKIYMDREPHLRLGVWFNGTEHVVVYKTLDGKRRRRVSAHLPWCVCGFWSGCDPPEPEHRRSAAPRG